MTNHHTHQSSTAQQKISNFLYQEGSFPAGELPPRFVEFCWRSIAGLRGDLLYVEPAFLPELNGRRVNDGEESALYLSEVKDGDIISLQPVPSNRPVIAIDTSTIKLGELENGSLCALRGSVVVLENNRYRYVRYGPLVFSLDSNNLAIFQDFSKPGLRSIVGEPAIDSLLKRVRNILERWLQFNVSQSVADAFILIDGSLTAGTPDNPCRELERILETARRNRSMVIAISKKTRLRVNNQSITQLLEQKSEPCLLDVDEEVTDQFPPYPVRFLGRVFVGKLARSGFQFRMDVDREIPMHETVEGFSQLTGTDIVDQGYPETLRMAHILSTFTASDVLAIQSFAVAQFGVQLIPKIALRRSLFGPFGTAWEAWH